jgi:hypothetical protein
MAKMKKVSIKELKNTFKSISNAEVKELGMSLINELEFMNTTLANLKKEIEEKGVVVTMPQGKYDIERSNPAIASYNTMVKNYNSTIKQLYELLNSNTVIESTDNFEDDDLS